MRKSTHNYRGPRFVRQQNANGIYRCFDKMTRKRISLKTRDQITADNAIAEYNKENKDNEYNMLMFEHFKNKIGDLIERKTWDEAIEIYCERNLDTNTIDRLVRGYQSPEFDKILKLQISETRKSHIMPLLKSPKGSVVKHMRQLHNFALEEGWLHKSLLPPKPLKIKKKHTYRAITEDEHKKLLATETREEWPEYLEMLFLTGGSQSDVAALKAEDFQNEVLLFMRSKNASPSCLAVGKRLTALLEKLPKSGNLFPKVLAMGQKGRSNYFGRRCKTKKVGISEVRLHSYRKSFAERAKKSGVPIELAMAGLGHQSTAVFEAYAKNAIIPCPSFDDEDFKPMNKCA